MKTFIHHDFPTLRQVNSKIGRTYQTEEGNKYPSVTSVTGLLSEESIQAWRKRVGEEEANRISRRASSRGTKIHSLCEKFLLNETLTPDPFNREMFESLVPYLEKIDNIHALETRLYSDELRVAGTVDVIAEYNGVLSVIDFKTSSRVKTSDMIESYFLQTAAYAFMFYEMTRIPIFDLVIIMGVDDSQPIVFHEKTKPWLRKFIEVREEYLTRKGI